ncbi:hypothetical protein [uncultured Winogradskyella sp.]|uniref:hypothetical protein n=1 Tax=uncultured Winogradskyella sp. TaxID=395353 RepID=UPI00262862A5|nr:hypothetical protein [uncultured Winogradskyella sp.]|tara:strand:- start:10251 stop:10628 length:378 start_codon:yes stop_codon:yes gene_type:complete
MRELLTFDICQMEIYDNHIITTVNEGIHLTSDDNNILIEVAEKFFSDSKFVYISNRINSYSLDPKVYYETFKVKNLLGLAIVSSNHKALGNAKIERLFFKKPYKIFSDMKEALLWTDELVSNSPN